MAADTTRRSPPFRWGQTPDGRFIKIQVECPGADSVQPRPQALWVTADGVSPNPPTLRIAAHNFSFDLKLAHEVKIDSLKEPQLYGQRFEIWFEKRTPEKWKYLYTGDKFRNEKTDPDLVMDSDSDDDKSAANDTSSTAAAAQMAKEFHAAKASSKAASKTTTKSSSSKLNPNSFSVKWDVALLLYSWALVLLCPYTKVEESFNMQAIHDIMFHQHDVDSYDHLVFTGPVPRTLLGSVAVSTASAPLAIILYLTNAPHWAFAYAARIVLATFLAASVSFIRYSVHKKFDRNTARWLGFVNLLQFHVPFYMSRTLPNTFALFFTNVAIGCILLQQHRYAVALLTASAVIFRCDTLVFAAPFVLFMLMKKSVTLSQFVATGVITAVPCVAMTVAVDSFFWKRLLWPEALVFLFNTLQNKSSEWGTLPWNWYFTSAIPRLLMAPTALLAVLLPYDAYNYKSNKQALLPWNILLPAVLYVALYSFLPHKELRFILPAVAAFNVCTAVAVSKLWELRRSHGSSSKGFWIKRIAEFSVTLLVVNAMGIVVLAYASHNNYPGGSALWQLHQLESTAVARNHSPSAPARVHIDVAAAQQGVSRFWQLDLTPGQHWSYSKQENITDFSSFNYCLSETPSIPGFSVIATANGFHPAMLYSAAKKPAIFVHKRANAAHDAAQDDGFD